MALGARDRSITHNASNFKSKQKWSAGIQRFIETWDATGNGMQDLLSMQNQAGQVAPPPSAAAAASAPSAPGERRLGQVDDRCFGLAHEGQGAAHALAADARVAEALRGVGGWGVGCVWGGWVGVCVCGGGGGQQVGQTLVSIPTITSTPSANCSALSHAPGTGSGRGRGPAPR